MADSRREPLTQKFLNSGTEIDGFLNPKSGGFGAEIGG
jgi:hypothetical protein